MATEVELIKSDTDLVLSKGVEDFTDTQWREYVGMASVLELDAILEKGKRIREFHIVYWNNRDKWNRDWSSACQDVLGLGPSTCTQYEIIHRIFDPDRLARVRHILPFEVGTLALLARAIEYDVQSVNEAAEKGIIIPAMGQETARKVLKTAQIIAQSNVAQLVRAGYTDDVIAERTQFSVKQITSLRKDIEETATNLNPEVEGPDVATEIPTPPPPIPVAPSKRIAKSAQEVLPPAPTVSPVDAITAEIEALGNVIGEGDLQVILDARLEYPEIFRTIAFWDAKFGPLAVETALRQLNADFNG
jgi:hypothetical protein